MDTRIEQQQNVPVAQCIEELGERIKIGSEVRIGGSLRRENFDRYGPTRIRINSPIDAGIPTLANLSSYFVWPQQCSR
jgi:hypothetical protein